MNHTNFNKESTEDLLEYIRWKNEPGYKETAEEAFKAFTFRFRTDLLLKLITVCGEWGYDEVVATEIGHRTFEKIWKSCQFDKSKAQEKDIDKAVKFYLYGIAQHELSNYKRKIEGNPHADDDLIFTEFPNIETMDLSKERKSFLIEQRNKIAELLDRMSWKHRVIYLTYIYYFKLTNGKYRLPRKVLENLRRELDLTQTSIRVYKNEAFKEVETYLNIYGRK